MQSSPEYVSRSEDLLRAAQIAYSRLELKDGPMVGAFYSPCA